MGHESLDETNGPNRGHDVDEGGKCRACNEQKPARGGWDMACPKDARAFMGGDES